jgi:homoserine kinase
VPRSAVRTAVARKALPETVPMADASANVAHGAMLTLGLATGDFSLIGRGLQDKLHQPYRAHLFPMSMALLQRAGELGAIGSTISGAGPTVLFWTQADTTGAVVGRLKAECEGWADVLRAPFESLGADVREL